MAEFDAYVLATACYNAVRPVRSRMLVVALYSLVPNLTLTVDYLFTEIKSKPWLIISYG